MRKANATSEPSAIGVTPRKIHNAVMIDSFDENPIITVRQFLRTSGGTHSRTGSYYGSKNVRFKLTRSVRSVIVRMCARILCRLTGRTDSL
jgi:hypothetical protein